MLVFLHLLHTILKVFILPSLRSVTVLFNINIRFLLLILQQFQFLNEDLDLRIMICRHFLTIGLFIQNSCMRLVNLNFSIVVKLLNHVTIHLNIVSLRFYFINSLFIQAKIILEFRSNHFHELIIRLLLLLWLFWWHKLQLFNEKIFYISRFYYMKTIMIKIIFLH